MVKKNLDLKLLTQLWRFENKSLKEIAEIMNTSPTTVHKNIKENSIIRCYNDAEWLSDMHYNQKKSLVEISKISNCTKGTVEKNMKRLNLKVDDAVTRMSQRKYSLNEDYFKNIDDEHKAYWLGFIMGDGHVSKRNSLSINLKSGDKNHIQKFLDDIESNHIINDYIGVIGDKKYDMAGINLYAAEMVRDLRRLGFTNNKSCKEFIPNIEDKYIKHFIQGYFDADGCICVDNRDKLLHVGFVGGFDLLNDISNIIEREIGYKISVRHKSNDLYHMSICGEKAIDVCRNYLYNNRVVILDRKFELFNNFNKI